MAFFINENFITTDNQRSLDLTRYTLSTLYNQLLPLLKIINAPHQVYKSLDRYNIIHPLQISINH